MWGVRAKKSARPSHPTLAREPEDLPRWSAGLWPLASHELLIDLHLSSMDEVDEVPLVENQNTATEDG